MRSVNPHSLSRRDALTSAAAFVLVANAHQVRQLRVLFVCEKGTVKSPIARELLRSRAKERGVMLSVRSRGVDPGPSASTETEAALRRDGIAIDRDPVHGLGPSDLAWADIVVTFYPLPVTTPSKDVRDWRDTPSVNANYVAAMADIGWRIEGLLDELAAIQRRAAR